VVRKVCVCVRHVCLLAAIVVPMTLMVLSIISSQPGDYRDGMQAKIANVIDCLKTEPLSKRAVIPIPFTSEGSASIDWKDQGQNKCCRELHFYLEDGKLKCTGIVRMQNANIFVKVC
jgi:thymidylate synthase